MKLGPSREFLGNPFSDLPPATCHSHRRKASADLLEMRRTFATMPRSWFAFHAASRKPIPHPLLAIPREVGLSRAGELLPPMTSTASKFIVSTGRWLINSISVIGQGVLFVAHAIVDFFFSRFRFEKWAQSVVEIGLRCTPIVLCIGLFAGMVLGLQGYYTLVRFGSESLLGPAVALTLIRELGPVLTALMIVGEAGSAMAAELGAQRSSDRIDYLTTTEVRPLGYLVGHRLLAALVCFPILTAFFDLIGIVGGYLTGVLLLHVDGGVYWSKLVEEVAWRDVEGGFVKALVFGILTTSICTFYGYFTHERATLPGVRGVSQTTTRAVVFSSVAVLVSDYMITSFYL